MSRFTTRFLASGLLAGLSLGLPATMSPLRIAYAQELKDELDALDDLPPDDLGGLPANGKKGADAAKSAKDAATDALDDLPSEEPAKAAKSAEASLPSDVPETSENLESLGSESDVSLEKELRSLDDKTKPEVNPPVASMTGVEAEPVGKVTSLDFRQLPDRVRLTIKGNRVMDWARELRSKRKQVLLEVKNMQLSRGVLRRALDTGEFDGPVALVQAFEAKAGPMPVVKVLFQLRQFADPTVLKTGNDLIVDFPILTDSTIFKNRSAEQVTIPETFLSINSKIAPIGQKINLRVKDAELSDVLNFISQASGKNFVLGNSVAAKVTLNVKATPWDEVLRIILVNAKMGYQKIGNVYRIAPVTEIQAEIDAAANSIKKSEDLIPLETRLYALSYAKASDVKTNITDFATSRGKSSVDSRTNTLIVTDVPETLEKIARYVKSVDRQTPQILIEARVVEASRSFLRNLNIQWKLGMKSTPLAGSNISIGTPGKDVNNNLQLNVAELGSWGSITALLGAQENEQNVKTIASPRIMTIDNQKAVMQQGDSFPVVTPATPNSPATTTYQDANLMLDVTPQVTSDGYVLMKVVLTRDFPTGGGNVSRRRADTNMLVESGKTIVLGGIYSSLNSNSQVGLPWARRVPVLGALFTNSNIDQETSNELLMFISPKVLNPDKAFFASYDRDLKEEDGPKPISQAGAESVPDDTF